jgi:DNA-binding transcriptional regulator PaaX
MIVSIMPPSESKRVVSTTSEFQRTGVDILQVSDNIQQNFALYEQLTAENGLGFYQLQKSCFIHPFECKSEIDFVTELYEVSSYVNFVLAKEIEGQTLLQKMFGLV